MRFRKLTLAALAVAASLSLTACNDEDLAGQTDPSSKSTSSSSSSSTDGSDNDAGQETTAGTDSGESTGTDKCRTDDLDISAADSTIDGDNEGTVAVELRNVGGRDCALSAYAGVDLKTDSGTLSAERTGEQADSSVLKDGKSTYFAVTYPLNDTGGSGVRVTALVVTPPDETKSFSMEWPTTATLPTSDGPDSPVRVGPIGSAGQGGDN